MISLNANWITENQVDFEYKKYLLLAYLSQVEQSFEQKKLYPYFSELIQHYKNVTSLKQNKKFMEETFPKNFTKIDLTNLNLEYEKIIQDDELMKEVEQIIDYSIPKFQKYLAEGKNIYDFIEEQLHLSPVGLIPLDVSYGYLFLRTGNKREARVYEYQVSIFESAEEKFRGINMNYLDCFQLNFTTTYNSIKADLLKKKPELPNPATYSVETELDIPFNETLFPIAKRMLMRHIGRGPATN